MDGSAKAGIDYTATTGTLTFSPGETMKSIAVQIINDTVPEPDESLTVTLTEQILMFLHGHQYCATMVDKYLRIYRAR